MPFPVASKNPLRLLANVRALTNLIWAEGVDIVHARSRAPAWSALAAARRTGRPFVTTYHGAYGEQGAAKRLYNSVMARGDAVIANSHFTADLIRSRYGTPEQRISVIHRGVDTAVFDAAALAPERIARLRAAWGVTPADTLVVHAARLTSWKGQREVVAALAAARPRLAGRPILVLAGDAQGRDDYRAALEADISRANLVACVRLVGHCDDMPAAFAIATIALSVAQEPEAFGRVAIEAQAMTCPVLATRLGAPPETVAGEPDVDPDATTGWLVAPGDSGALAEALVTALSLPAEARAAMGARARARVIERFSLAAMQRATLAVYDRLIGTRMAQTFDADLGKIPVA